MYILDVSVYLFLLVKLRSIFTLLLLFFINYSYIAFEDIYL